MNNLKKKKRIETSASIQLRLTLSQCGGKGCHHPAKRTQTKIMFFLCTWMMRMMIFSGGAEDGSLMMMLMMMACQYIPTRIMMRIKVMMLFI